MFFLKQTVKPFLAVLTIYIIGFNIFGAVVAKADRPLPEKWIQGVVHDAVKKQLCGQRVDGGRDWSCRAVYYIPIHKCGYHSWCWNSTLTHREGRFCINGCLQSRTKGSSGWIDGHTGIVYGLRER